MNVTNQMAATIGIILDPKKTLISLPSDRIWITAPIVALFLLVPNVLSLKLTTTHQSDVSMTNITPQIMWFIFFFILFAYILKWVAKIINRPITTQKAINIIGYSQAPRVLVTLAVAFIAWLIPSAQQPGTVNTILNAIVYAGTLYSLALIVFGVNWSVEAVGLKEK